MKSDDQSYYRRRADEERAYAVKALSAEARRAHLAMAERYQALADRDPGVGADGDNALWPPPQPESPAA